MKKKFEKLFKYFQSIEKYTYSRINCIKNTKKKGRKREKEKKKKTFIFLSL